MLSTVLRVMARSEFSWLAEPLPKLKAQVPGYSRMLGEAAEPGAPALFGRQSPASQEAAAHPQAHLPWPCWFYTVKLQVFHIPIPAAWTAVVCQNR